MPKTYHKWKIGTVNIRTGKDDEKLERVVNEINKANITICGLQEVRRLNKSSAIIKTNTNSKYEVYWSGNQTKRQHGVGIVVKVDPNIDIVEVTSVNSRLIVLDVNVYGCCLRIINCYAPTEESTLYAKNNFYCQLKKQFQNINKQRKVICIGDFNATSSACLYNSSLREGSIIENLVVNDNGSRFHELINDQKLSVLNTWFSHKICRRITWHSPDGFTKKVYDFILSCSWLRMFTTNCRVYNSYDFDSDHRLVVASLQTPVTKIARFIGRKKVIIKKKIDYSAINDEIETNFVNAVTRNLSNPVLHLDNSNLQLTENLINAVTKSADDTLPKQNLVRITQPWHDDQKLHELFMRKNDLMKCNADRKTIIAVRKKIRMRVKYLKNEYFKQEAENINQMAINRELERLFKRARNQETTLKPINSTCSPDKILKHFKNHFNPEDPSQVRTPEELTDNNLPEFVEELRKISDDVSINDLPPTIEEIQKHLKELKARKASNDIDSKLLQKLNSHPIMLQVVHRMTTNLWDNLDLPMTWGNSLLKTLWKGKGSKKDPAKYRGISIGSTVCKLVMNIILNRLRPWYESQLSDHQNGFRGNRGTTDGIYTVKRIQQISSRKKQPLFLLFVDLSAAFDHVPRKSTEVVI